MWFWIFVFICNQLIPLLMIGMGRAVRKRPPERSGAFGYRTSMSMKNNDTWNFAHKTLGKFWWKAGWVLFTLCTIIELPFYKSEISVISISSGVICAIECIVLLASIIPVETALKKHFYPDGTRK